VIVRKFPIEHLDPISLLGHNDSNVRQIEREIPVRITLRDGTLSVAGEEHEVRPAVRVLEELVELVERGRVIEEADVSTALGQARRGLRRRARVHVRSEGRAPAHAHAGDVPEGARAQ